MNDSSAHYSRASSRLPRSCLVVPASDSRKVSKALASAADEIVLDLEDAVAPDAKVAAREVVLKALGTDHGKQLAIRINQVGTPWCHWDVLDVAGAASSPITLVVPKVDSAQDAAFIDRLVRGALAEKGGNGPQITIDVLLESAAALSNIKSILTATGMMRAAIIGYADLGADLGRAGGEDPTLWDAVRHNVVVAARAAGCGLIDGPWLATSADDAFVADRERARAFGFDGTWVIHPAQVDVATRLFTPSTEEVSWARRVLSALGEAVTNGRGAVAVDGQMIDEAVAVRARSVLDRAGSTP